jgi:hypothetical protein
MVASHERSGTHFLMNALAAEFGFVASPFLAVDANELKINFFHPQHLASFFVHSADRKIATLRKTHYQFAFFGEIIGRVLEHTRVFYIYRDPRDVSHSYRHFLNHLPWFEGPKVAEATAFIREVPAGAMLRYQYRQAPNMLKRWQVHVEEWLEAAAKHRSISVIRYEDLRDRYEETLKAIAERHGWAGRHQPRPSKVEHKLLMSRADPSTDLYSEQDLQFFNTEIGETMRRLQYDI